MHIWDTAFVYDDIDDVWAHWSELYNDTIEKHAPTIFFFFKTPCQSTSLDQCSEQKGNAIGKQVVQKISSLLY